MINNNINAIAYNHICMVRYLLILIIIIMHLITSSLKMSNYILLLVYKILKYAKYIININTTSTLVQVQTASRIILIYSKTNINNISNNIQF